MPPLRSAGTKRSRVLALVLLFLATESCRLIRSRVTIENRSGIELTDVRVTVRSHAILELGLGSLPAGQDRSLPLSALPPASLGFAYSGGGRELKGECARGGSIATHWVITVRPSLDTQCAVK